MRFERATNPSLGNFAAMQDNRLQSSRPHWRQPRVRLGGLKQKTIAAVFATTFAMPVLAQDFLAKPGAPAAAFPNPNRPVADIISPIWHDEKERDDANEPRQLVRLLGIRSGMTVADIGAGSGYYVVRLSPVVGPRGRIIAEDVVPEYIQGLRKRVRDRGLQNVVINRGEPHDPGLPADSLDLAILVHMYHEIAQPYGLLYNLVPALSTGARAATLIWPSLCRHPLRAGHRRKPWSPARRVSRVPQLELGSDA